jgi:plasmid stabilization system protein ParE
MENNSTYSSILSSRAQKEIAISWEWYEERQVGLGDGFVKEVIARIKDIQKNPERYPVRYKSYQEVSVPSFPFILIYRVIKKQRSVRIISVFHTSQNPQKKYK